MGSRNLNRSATEGVEEFLAPINFEFVSEEGLGDEKRILHRLSRARI